LNDGNLRALYEQKALAFRRHPSLGRISHRVNVALASELACVVRASNHVSLLDLPSGEGGRDSAPTPGDAMRASLGACLAMACRVWGARLGIEVQSVEVDVICELDARGQLGIAPEVPAGWQRLLFDVRIRSSAAVADVERVVEHAERLSPLLANLSPAIERVRTLSLERPRNHPISRERKDLP
jgi:uncharacterized OsmC-like protein